MVTFPQRFAIWFVGEIRWLFRVIVSSCDRFYWDNGFTKAASLAYTTLLSLVPVTALVFGVLGSFAQEYGANVRKFIFMHFLPSTQAADTVIQHLTDFSATISNLSGIVMCFLVVTALLLLNSIEYALNEIWQVFEPRSISHRVAIFCAIIIIAPVLAVSAYYTNFRIEPLLLEYGVTGYLNTAYDYLWPFLIDYSAFVFIYYFVPKAPVQFRSASFGAFLAALLFDVAKKGFAFYIVSFSSYEKIYGTLAAIPIFLFWLYLAWSILLFGAEVCYQAQYLPKKGKIWKRSVLSVGDGKMLLAMQTLVTISRAFIKGETLPNELDIAENLGCSSVVLKPAIDELEKAQIILRGDTRSMPLTLMRNPEKISLEEIREALFAMRSSIHYPEEMTRLFASFSKGADRHKVTLADIVRSNEE